MKKKLGVFLILGAMCATLLVGCDADPASVSSAPQSDTPSTIVSSETSETTSSEALSSETSAVSEIPTVDLVLDEQKGDNVGEFMQLVGVQNDAIDKINDGIAALMEDYQEIAAHDDGSWAEYRSYVDSNSRYINIIVHYNTYPTYGTQGKIAAFTYDIVNQKALDAEDCMSQVGTNKDQLQDLFEHYYATETESNPYRNILNLDIVGCKRNVDGTADFYLIAETEPKDDAPEAYQTTKSDNIYIYHTADSSFAAYDGNSDLMTL